MWKDSRGYLVQWHNGKEVRVHRVVAEMMLGRQLEKGEQVHHRNGDKSDNRPINLEIVSADSHIRAHWNEGLYSSRVQANAPKDEKCSLCDFFGRLHAHGQCRRCYHRMYARRRKECGRHPR